MDTLATFTGPCRLCGATQDIDYMMVGQGDKLMLCWPCWTAAQPLLKYLPSAGFTLVLTQRARFRMTAMLN